VSPATPNLPIHRYFFQTAAQSEAEALAKAESRMARVLAN
jgi:hypothetical protein